MKKIKYAIMIKTFNSSNLQTGDAEKGMKIKTKGQ
jgi:hypothetical protein